MRFIYNNFEIVNEKHILKRYRCFDEIIILKSCKSSGFECINKKHSSSVEISRVSSSRIKSKIRDLALMNDFTYFYTQTINSSYDRFNLEEFKNLILKKFKAYRRINKDFIYLIIFEKHKNGAFHLHGLLGGLGIDLQKNVNGYDTLNFFADIGFNSLSIIKDKERVSNYILKYISKDISKTLSGYSYFHSKGLNVPVKEEIFVDNFDNLELVFENKYIKKFKRRCYSMKILNKCYVEKGQLEDFTQSLYDFYVNRFRKSSNLGHFKEENYYLGFLNCLKFYTDYFDLDIDIDEDLL